MSNASTVEVNKTEKVTVTHTTTLVGNFRFILSEYCYSSGITYYRALYTQMRNSKRWGQLYDCNYAGFDAVYFNSWNHSETELRKPIAGQSLSDLITEVFNEGKYNFSNKVFTTRELAQAAIDRVIAKKKLQA